MGEVYRARDRRLRRDVAVKVVRARFFHDERTLERFDVEAKALAALHHPSILAIYDVGSEGGVSYAVTELLEGETLRERMRSTPLSWQEAVPIAIAIADAIRAAHTRGVIHRDLKPENVYLTREGEVKVLDFGLARLTERARALADARIDSDCGAIMGTTAYMSPEQTRGESVDERSDVFSFGVVLHEVLTGLYPFEGTTSAEIMASIQRDEPRAAKAPSRDIPAELMEIARRCLRKKSEDRIASAADLVERLRAFLKSVEAPPQRAPRPLIAVAAAACVAAVSLGVLLAVRPRYAGPGEDADYLMGGVALDTYEETTNPEHLQEAIHRFSAVVAKNPEHAGAHRGLSQAYLALSGVENAPPNAEQEAISHAAAFIRLLHASARDDPGQDDPNYLQGAMRLDTGTAKDNEHAMKCFSEAIRSNPRHARAHAGLALAWWERSGVFLMPADAMEKARRSALDALALDATLPEAHIALALVLYRYDWNWTGALAHLEEARSLAPDSFRAQQEYGRYLMLRGQFDEAAKVLAQAQRLDLFLLGNLDVDLGECSYFAGDHAAAIKHTSRVIESKPSRRKAQRFKAYWIRGEARAKLGRLKDAAQDLEMACDIEPDQTELLAGLCHIYVAAGKREKAEEIFKDLLGQGTGGRYVSHVALAVASAALGDRGRAFDILRGDAVASRDEWLVYLKVDPIFRDVGLAQDGRFQELLLQVGL